MAVLCQPKEYVFIAQRLKWNVAAKGVEYFSLMCGYSSEIQCRSIGVHKSNRIYFGNLFETGGLIYHH